MTSRSPASSPSNWQQSLNPRLTRRLLRPLVHPGMVDFRLGRQLLARSQPFSATLPFATQMLRRHTIPEEIGSGQPPTVYAKPLPPPEIAPISSLPNSKNQQTVVQAKFADAAPASTRSAENLSERAAQQPAPAQSSSKSAPKSIPSNPATANISPPPAAKPPNGSTNRSFASRILEKGLEWVEQTQPGGIPAVPSLVQNNRVANDRTASDSGGTAFNKSLAPTSPAEAIAITPVSPAGLPMVQAFAPTSSLTFPSLLMQSPGSGLDRSPQSDPLMAPGSAPTSNAALREQLSTELPIVRVQPFRRGQNPIANLTQPGAATPAQEPGSSLNRVVSGAESGSQPPAAIAVGHPNPIFDAWAAQPETIPVQSPHSQKTFSQEALLVRPNQQGWANTLSPLTFSSSAASKGEETERVRSPGFGAATNISDRESLPDPLSEFSTPLHQNVNTAISQAIPMSRTQPPPLRAEATGSVDVNAIAEQVERKLMRRLIVERERRGWRC